MEMNDLPDMKNETKGESKLSLLASDGTILKDKMFINDDQSSLGHDQIKYKNSETLKQSLKIDTRTRRKSLVAIGISIALILIAASVTVGLLLNGKNLAPGKHTTSKPLPLLLEAFIDDQRLMTHLLNFQAIALAHGNSRSHKHGFNASLEYIVNTLEREAPELEQTIQRFPIKIFENKTPPTLRETEDNITTELLLNRDFVDMGGFTGATTVRGKIYAVYEFGCAQRDYKGFSGGAYQFALIKRGQCTFSEKIELAKHLGARAILIFNDGVGGDRVAPFRGNFGVDVNVPVFSLSFVLGSLLVYKSRANVTLELRLNSTQYTIDGANLCAETTDSLSDQTVIIGSHLDSVDAGPGINDNGSGSAANLELAIQLNKNFKAQRLRTRFCWWGGEELGLLGSTYYVSQLEEEERADIYANINLDMIASPNKFYGIYNGTMAHAAIRNLSEHIAALFIGYFNEKRLSYSLTEFDGRSDYGPFIDNDTLIAAGGLFTGAEQLKTEKDRARFGGLTNAPFDPCYHQACDTIENVDMVALKHNTMASARVLQTLIK